MPQDDRFFLIANINHFTALLRNVHLPNQQETAIRLLLADSRRRLAELDAHAFRGGDLLADQPSPAIPPPKTTEHSAPAAIQRAGSRQSASAAARLASA